MVEILEDSKYSSAEQMAKAVIKAVAETLGDRQWYGYAHRFGEGDAGRMWGLFPTVKEVERFANTVGLQGDVIAYPIHPSAALLRRIEESEAELDNTHCDQCGHLRDIHRHEGAKGRVLTGCAVPGCSCTRGK